MPERQPADRRGRTLSYRAVAIGIASTVAMAIWIHYHEVLSPRAGILAENSPPAGAVGVFVGVLLIGALVWRLAPRFRLQTGELVVIYTMLVTSAPLMTQGMWHRFLGLLIAIPENKDNLALVDSYSDKLWPHGPHLIENRRFDPRLPCAWTVEPASAARQINAPDSPVGPTTAIELDNPAPADPAADPDALSTTLSLRVPRRTKEGREQLVPGERYYFNGLFRLSGLKSRSRLMVELLSDGGERSMILSAPRNTPATYSARGGFHRFGEPYLSLPRDVKDHIDLVFTLEGVGRAAITDVALFSNEALARLRKGSVEVLASQASRVPPNQRDSLLVRPDRMASPAGLWYAVKGYVPYAQWGGPLLWWCSIVLAIFFCLLGVAVIFRRQWADHERFSFPLVMLPRLLLEEEEQPGGPRIRPLFRKRTFRIGLGIAVVYTLLQALAFYIPGMPNPTVDVNIVEYPRSPAVKAFVTGMYNSNFQVSLLMTSVAFFIDLEMLASILVCFWACKIPYLFGEVLGWKTIKGPFDNFPFPHEQHIGAFLGLALIAVWIARKHLAAVGRRVLGRPGGADDSAEAMSYRSAAVLIVLSLAFMGVWGALTGLGWANALIFFGFIVVCGFSAARIRTECGAPFTYFTPYFPFLTLYLLGGLKLFSTETMVLAYCVGGFMAVAQFLMFAPTQVEMFHLGSQFNARPRGIGWGLVLGVLAGVLVGGYVMLVWGYGKGGDNIAYMKTWAMRQNWYLTSLRQSVAEADSEALAATSQPLATAAQPKASGYPRGPLLAAGLGTGITILLTFLRMHFVGFWLHPIGYVLANSYLPHMCWGSLLVAWVLKLLGLKIGGPRLIRDHLTPLMAGVFCGAVLSMFLWDVGGVAALAGGARDVFTAFP